MINKAIDLSPLIDLFTAAAVTLRYAAHEVDPQVAYVLVKVADSAEDLAKDLDRIARVFVA